MKSIYPFWVDSNFENERGLYWNLVNQNPCRPEKQVEPFVPPLSEFLIRGYAYR